METFFLFIFWYKKGLKNFWINEKYLHIFYIPLLKNKKNKQKMIKYLKEAGIKKVCISDITDEFLLKNIKENFEIIQGEQVFYHLFEKIIDKFMKMQALLYEECELVFISNDDLKVKKYLEKIIKKFKKVSIYTSQKHKFKILAEEVRNIYGTTLFLKDKTNQPQKYKKIYVNLEKENMFECNFFKNVYLIDIYQQYDNSFCNVILRMSFEEESVLKKHKISQNICFLEYMMEESKISIQKEYKIVNIRKI